MSLRTIVSLLLLIASFHLFAQTNQDFWGFWCPQNIETGTLVTACAGAGVAMTDEPGAVLVNPSNLPMDSKWGWTFDLAALRNVGRENGEYFSTFRTNNNFYSESTTKEFLSHEIIPQFAGVWFSKGAWAFGAFSAWNVQYRVNYDLYDTHMAVYNPNDSGWGIDYPAKSGQGTVEKHETSFVAAYRLSKRWRVALAAVWLHGHVHITSLSWGEPNYFWDGLQKTRGSYDKLVPQVGISYMSDKCNVGLSYRWSARPKLTSDSGPTPQPTMFHQSAKEFLEPAIARVGASIKMKTIMLLMQYEYSWSSQQNGHVALPPWYAPVTFRTDDDQALRVAVASVPLTFLHGLEFQVGYARLRHSGWYYPQSAPRGAHLDWADLMMDYYQFRFPKRADYNVFSGGISVPISSRWSIRSSGSYASGNRSLQVGMLFRG